MAEKTLQTRIALKYDSYVNWTNEEVEGQGANLVLLKGEIGICEIPSGNTAATTAPTVLFKVGDGELPFKSLKWASALAADVHGWAKSETVVFDEVIETDDEGAETGRKHYIRFKNGENVVKELDLSTFITDAEVDAIVTGINARLANIEAAIGAGEGDDSISDQIADITGRLDVIEGKGEGSVAKAKADAIAHTDAEIGNYASGVEGEDDYVAASGVRKEIAEAQAAAQAYTDVAVEAINANAAELDAAIKKEAEDREAADKAITDVIGTGFEATETGTVAAKVKAAQDAADAAQKAADDAQADVDALTAADGQVTANTAAIAQLNTDLGTESGARADADAAINAKIGGSFDAENTVAAAITAAADAASVADGKAVAAQNAVDALTADDGQVTVNAADIAQLKTDLATETTNRTNADNALDERLDKVEAFFEGAYAEDGQPLNDALDTLVEIQNLLSTEEGAAAGELLDAITELQGVVGKAAEGEDEATGLVKDAADAKADIADLKADTADLLDIVDGYETKGSIKTAVDAAQAQADKGVEDAGKAQAAAEAADGKAVDAQNRVGALEAVVPGISETASDAQTRVAALEPKVEQAEKDIDALEAVVLSGENTNAQLRADIEALEAIVVTGADANETLGAEIDAIAAKVNDETTGLANTYAIATDAQTRVAALEPRVQTAEEAITNITKADGLIATAKQEAIDAAATDASNKAADALSDAQTYADGLNTAMNTRVESLETDVAEIKSDYLKAGDVYIFNCGSSTEVIH